MKIHIVKKGETLYGIAQKYNVPLEELIKANPVIANPDDIDVGLKVKIPAPSAPTYELIHQHTVQQGDTLWKLSKAWGIPLADMIKANPQLKNPNVLLTGEIVNIPKLPPLVGAGVQPHDGVGANVQKQPTGKKFTGVKEEKKVEAEAVPMPEIVPLPELPAIPAPPAPVAPAPVAPEKEKKSPYPALDHDLFAQMPVPAVEADLQTITPAKEDVKAPFPGVGGPVFEPSKDFGYGGHGHFHGAPFGYDYGYSYGYPYSVDATQAQLPATVEGAIGSVFDSKDVSGYEVQQASYGDISNIPGAVADASTNLPGVTGYLPAYVPGLVSPATVKPSSGCAGCGGVPSWQASPASANLPAAQPTYVSPAAENAPYHPYMATFPAAANVQPSVEAVQAANVMPAANIMPVANVMPSMIPTAVSPAAGKYPGLEWPGVAGASYGYPGGIGYPYGHDHYAYPAAPYGIAPYSVYPYEHAGANKAPYYPIESGIAPEAIGANKAPYYPVESGIGPQAFGANKAPYYPVESGIAPQAVSPFYTGMPIYPGAVPAYPNVSPGDYVHSPHFVPYGTLHPVDPFGIPPIPPLPPLREHDKKPESLESAASLHAVEEEEDAKPASVQKKRQTAKKKTSVPRRSKSRSKESLPWIR